MVLWTVGIVLIGHQTNEDTSDNDTDNTIIYKTDKLKKTNRENINTIGKRAKNVKAKKSRTAKIYTMNIERKRPISKQWLPKL